MSQDKQRKAEWGWQRTRAIRQALGITDKLAPGGMPWTRATGVLVRVLSQEEARRLTDEAQTERQRQRRDWMDQHGRRTVTHRLYVQCPDCGAAIPCGRMSQHVGSAQCLILANPKAREIAKMMGPIAEWALEVVAHPDGAIVAAIRSAMFYDGDKRNYAQGLTLGIGHSIDLTELGEAVHAVLGKTRKGRALRQVVAKQVEDAQKGMGMGGGE